MLDTQKFGDFLQNLGLRDFVGVPCSYLSPLINYAINEQRFIMSNNEGDAVAIASGISLSGQVGGSSYGVVLMQNSGLSNALSPLTSLNYTFGIPILGFVSLRGERDSQNQNTDEPQHELLGVITDKLLSTCEVAYDFLSPEMSEAKAQIQRALEVLKEHRSFFFIVRDKTFSKVCLTQIGEKLEVRSLESVGFGTQDLTLLKNPSMSNSQSLPARLQALEILHSLASHHCALLLATTGKCGRELYEVGDSANQLYMVGSMGCVSALSLGLSLKTTQKVIAIDGDSALLMRLGALSTNAYYARENFCHILLDNESHDSTGGQFNLSPFVDFAYLARFSGYPNVRVAENLVEFEEFVREFLGSQVRGAWFIYLKIAKGSKENLGRPKITPKEVARRLQAFIQTSKARE